MKKRKEKSARPPKKKLSEVRNWINFLIAKLTSISFNAKREIERGEGEKESKKRSELIKPSKLF